MIVENANGSEVWVSLINPYPKHDTQFLKGFTLKSLNQLIKVMIIILCEKWTWTLFILNIVCQDFSPSSVLWHHRGWENVAVHRRWKIKGVMIPFRLIRNPSTLYVTGSGGSKLLDLTKWRGWRKPWKCSLRILNCHHGITHNQAS